MRLGTLPDCELCGRTNPDRMIAVMTQFFGELLELPEEPGYVYICPDCYEQQVAPHSDALRELLRAHSEPRDDMDEDEPEGRPEHQ